MEFIKKEIDGDIINLPKIKEGDIVSLCFEDRDELDLVEFLDDYTGDLIVESVDYEAELFWIKDCDYAINILWVSNVVDSSVNETYNEEEKDSIWFITATNNYSYSYPEINSKWAKNYNEALSYFKFFIDKYIELEKENFVDKYNASNNLSLSEYRIIAAQNGDTVSYGYSSNENEKIFTIDKLYGATSDTEEFIIRMYKIEAGKTDFSTLVTLEHNDNIDEIVNNIKCF